ncbi:hypothetical protein DV515_00011190 [Chloebia gouldiae]|uniref:Uncharacterized protein n=1 Tax=Chloebia gouldiae TaxID=44316 RepID=A0A3L8S7V8_CHLGU|nr:hypothetical protein DV515_00011190 [Chloebia gouldiae]
MAFTPLATPPCSLSLPDTPGDGAHKVSAAALICFKHQLPAAPPRGSVILCSLAIAYHIGYDHSLQQRQMQQHNIPCSVLLPRPLLPPHHPPLRKTLAHLDWKSPKIPGKRRPMVTCWEMPSGVQVGPTLCMTQMFQMSMTVITEEPVAQNSSRPSRELPATLPSGARLDLASARLGARRALVRVCCHQKSSDAQNEPYITFSVGHLRKGALTLCSDFSMGPWVPRSVINFRVDFPTLPAMEDHCHTIGNVITTHNESLILPDFPFRKRFSHHTPAP